MKLKKLFAGVVAVAMMATMSFPAFAARPTPTRPTPNVGANGLVTITKNYKVVGSEDKKAPAETFNFTVTPGATIHTETGDVEKTVEKSEATTIPAMAANSDKKTVEFTTALTADGTGTFTVDVANLNITKPGIYYYTVTETAGNTAGVDYAADPMIMVITAGYADDDENSTLSYWVGLHDSKVFNDKNKPFENTYTAGSLNVTKKVTGSLGNKDKKFNIDVTFTAPAGKTVNSTITYVNNGEKTIAPAAWKLNTTTNKYEATVTVELAHKESVQFNNIPKDVTYIVEEQDYSREEYTATYEEDSKSGTIANNVKSTTITNKRGDDTIDTGVILDNAPYILMLTVVAAGAMTLVIKKRREEE